MKICIYKYAKKKSIPVFLENIKFIIPWGKINLK